MKNKEIKGILITVLMIFVTGSICFKTLGEEPEIDDAIFEKLYLYESYTPEQQIVNKYNFKNLQSKIFNLYFNSSNKNMEKNHLNKNVYTENLNQEKTNINAYYNTINCIEYLDTELYDKKNKKLEEELFILAENYIYNSRMGNLENIKLNISPEIKESIIDLNSFMKKNNIVIKDICFDRENYDFKYYYLATSLPIEIRVSYAYEIEDNDNLLLGSLEQTVYLDLTNETLYSDWKENKKNNNYKFKVVGLENYIPDYE